MLTLDNDVTYAELQTLIYQHVDVPTDRQKIRIGFPPKLLEAPAAGKASTVVPLHHGDKIALEILPVLCYPVQGKACIFRDFGKRTGCAAAQSVVICARVLTKISSIPCLISM